MNSVGSPPARGRRIDWTQLPADLRMRIESWLNTHVTAAVTQPSGFSPGVASTLSLSDGREVFIKAAHPSTNPHAPRLHRREALIAASLPREAPVPSYLGCLDEGEDGWVVLAFDLVRGRHPHEPWTDPDLETVYAGLHQLTDLLTPSPVETEPASEFFARHLRGWQLLSNYPQPGLDTHTRARVTELAALEAEAPRAVQGESLLHLDIRADNILISDGKPYFIDWPHARVGASWVDWVAMAPSVAMQGGPAPEVFLSRFRRRADVPEAAIDQTIAALAGYFTYQSLLPEPSELPNLRAFQAAQAEIARGWLAQRLDWDEDTSWVAEDPGRWDRWR